MRCSGRCVRGVVTSESLWSQASPARRHGLVLLAHQRIKPELMSRGLSVAFVLGFPLPSGSERRPPQLIHPCQGARQVVTGRRSGMTERVAQLAPEEIWRTGSDVRVTSPVRTVLDCARELATDNYLSLSTWPDADCSAR